MPQLPGTEPVYLLELFVQGVHTIQTNDECIKEKMEHQHVKGTGTETHCSGVEVTAPSNYNQWRLIPALKKKSLRHSQRTYFIYHV